MFCAVTSQSGNFFVSCGAAAQWQNLRGLSKHHWCLHMASCLSILKCLPSCPAMERKQKVVHKYGNNIMNTTQYEKSLLSKVLREHLAHLEADEENLTQGAHMSSPVPTTRKIQKQLMDTGFVLAEPILFPATLADLLLVLLAQWGTLFLLVAQALVLTNVVRYNASSKCLAWKCVFFKSTASSVTKLALRPQNGSTLDIWNWWQWMLFCPQ